jgi:hypothetical protein
MHRTSWWSWTTWMFSCLIFHVPTVYVVTTILSCPNNHDYTTYSCGWAFWLVLYKSKYLAILIQVHIELHEWRPTVRYKEISIYALLFESYYACSGLENIADMGYSKAAGIATNRTIFVSINCLLSLICAFVYIALCVRLTRQFHKPEDVHSGGGATELAKLKWRLALIVLINTACWMAVSIIHILRLLYTYDFMVSQDLISEDLIAVSVVLISTSPTINPLIYTIAGKQFLKFLKRCWKFLKCQISIRPSWETEHDYYLIGEKRCSCIPCIQCTVPRDLDRWNTEESSLFSSDEHSHDDSANLNWQHITYLFMVRLMFQ